MQLELRGITKRFGDFTANDAIDLVVEPGQIHALLGENGAGKSTLMNVLYGLYQPDEGEILLDGRARAFAGPGDAMAAGIGMVHQHFMLVPVFTVAENVILGDEPTRGGLLDLAAARRRVREISERYSFGVDPDALVEDLPVGIQQRVEIIKALVREARVLILDEPTAVLTPQETDELMAIMRELAAGGTSIVFITHKLREVRAVADRISVIRRGRVVGSAGPGASESELAALMVGRDVSLTVAKDPPRPTEHGFVVERLSVADAAGQLAVREVSLEARGGEVLAIAGVQGNGQTELVEALVGLRRAVAGHARLDGDDLIGRTTRQVLAAGVGYVPEDRGVDGLVKQLPVADNLVTDLIGAPEFSRAGVLRLGAIAANAAARVAEFDIRTPSPDTPAGNLSGGNQQKVVMAREFSRPLRLLIASQPTRGVDVGSIEFLHTRIVAERDRGIPVVIVSTELDEVIALADRIAVMYRGRVVGVVPPDISRSALGLMMAGVDYASALAQAEGDAVPADASAPAETAAPAAAARAEGAAAPAEEETA